MYKQENNKIHVCSIIKLPWKTKFIQLFTEDFCCIKRLVNTVLMLQTCSHCKACSWTYALLSSNLSEIKWYILSESVPKGKGHKSMSKDLLQKRKYTLFSMYCLVTRLHWFNVLWITMIMWFHQIPTLIRLWGGGGPQMEPLFWWPPTSMASHSPKSKEKIQLTGSLLVNGGLKSCFLHNSA